MVSAAVGQPVSQLAAYTTQSYTHTHTPALWLRLWHQQTLSQPSRIRLRVFDQKFSPSFRWEKMLFQVVIFCRPCRVNGHPSNSLLHPPPPPPVFFLVYPFHIYTCEEPFYRNEGANSVWQWATHGGG